MSNKDEELILCFKNRKSPILTKIVLQSVRNKSLIKKKRIARENLERISIDNAYEEFICKRKESVEAVPAWESGVKRGILLCFVLKTVEVTKFYNSDEKVPVKKEALMMQKKDLEKARWDRI